MTFKRYWLGLVLLSGSLVACISSATAATDTSSKPASWVPHDMIVRLNHLPKRYSCDDLWYRFRDVLVQIGARPDFTILPYRCESALGEASRSPSIHLQFQLPEALQGKLVQWADFRAANSVVTFEPGKPASFDASDCELLRQIKDTLLKRLSYPIPAYHLPCRAEESRGPEFSLSVVAFKRFDDSTARVASVTANTPTAASRARLKIASVR